MVSSTETIIAIGEIHAQVPHLPAVREIMRETQRQTREQPGCMGYTFAETLEDPGHFLVVHQWRDRSAFEEHYRSTAFAVYQTRVGGLLVRESQLRVYAVHEGLHPLTTPGDNPQFDE